MGNVSKNAPAARNLLADHQELMRKISGFRMFWQDASERGKGAKSDELADHLSEIRDLLLDHFAVEEEGGYLSEVLEIAPELSEQATELCGQHREFVQVLDELETRLRQSESDFQNWVCGEFDSLIDSLQDHEHRENDLVQSAFSQDVGAGD